LNEHLASLSVLLSGNAGSGDIGCGAQRSPLSENGCAPPESAQSKLAMSSGTERRTGNSEIRVK